MAKELKVGVAATVDGDTTDAGDSHNVNRRPSYGMIALCMEPIDVATEIETELERADHASNSNTGRSTTTGTEKVVRPCHVELNRRAPASSERTCISPVAPPPSRLAAKWGLSREKTTTATAAPRYRSVSVYYKRQQKDIAVLRQARRLSSLGAEEEQKYFHRSFLASLEEETDGERQPFCKCSCSCLKISVDAATRLTLAANFFLFFLKFAATIQSGSLAVLSSLVDSGLDLFAGAVIGVSSYLIKRYNRYHYPTGRNRLEPVAIIITAAVMGTAALQIITKAIEDIAEDTIDPNINLFSGLIIALTVLLKGILYILCQQSSNPSVKTLAVDHRNDVVSNLATLIFGLLGTYVYKLLDPIGAILMAIYIIINWIIAGYVQVKNLVGRTAKRRFLNMLTWIAANHHKSIEAVDTVRAYTFGVNYLVEVDIQLAPDMQLQEAHDIGESLQQKLESLDEVERAFVHLDFETLHSPTIEHKLPH